MDISSKRSKLDRRFFAALGRMLFTGKLNGRNVATPPLTTISTERGTRWSRADSLSHRESLSTVVASGDGLIKGSVNWMRGARGVT